MPREQSFYVDLMNRFDYTRQVIKTSSLVLGGSSGSGGGGGSPTGGFSGQLPQTRVAGDTDELRVLATVTSGSGSSLLTNLNNIRFWETTQISATEPATTFAGQHWIDGSSGSALKIRNETNTAWITTAGGGGSLDPSSPADIGSAAVVGTSGSSSHGDHAHRGVRGIYAPSNASAFGDIALLGSGDISVTQSSGSFIFAGSSGSYLPQIHDINGQYHDGTPLRVGSGGLGTAQAPTAGAIPIGTSGGIYAPNHLIAGTNVTIMNSSGSVTISASGGGGGGGVDLDPSSPLDVSSSTSVGTSGSASHGDHVHRGVHGIYTSPNAFAYGDIDLIAGNGITLSQSSGSFTIDTSGSFIPATHGINGAYHIDFPLRAENGGTGVIQQPASGAVLIGKSDGTYAPNNLIAGSNITITNSSGSVTIAATGGSGVTGIYTLPNTVASGIIDLVAGSNISITQSSGSFTFSSSSSGGTDFLVAQIFS